MMRARSCWLLVILALLPLLGVALESKCSACKLVAVRSASAPALSHREQKSRALCRALC